MLKQRHQTFVALLCLADACVVAAAAIGAWGLRRAVLGESLAEPPLAILRESLLVFVIPTTVYLMWAFGLYRPRRDRGVGAEIVQIIKASLASIVAIVVLLFLVGGPAVAGWNGDSSVHFGTLALDDGRIQMLTLAAVLPVALSVERLGFRLALRAIRRRGRNLRHVAIIGSGRLGQICCRTLDRNTWTGIHVAYFVSHNDHARPNTTLCDRPIIGGVADLEALMEHHRPDAVYLALPNARASMMPGLLRRLEKFPIDVRIIPDVHPRYTPLSMSINELDGMPILSVRESPLEGIGGAAKRALDLCGSLVALLLFAPVMAAVALAVRMSSPGPVIFRQKRVSLGGEAFEIYKFRTMFHVEDEFAAGEAPNHASWTARNDPRVTPLGRWLRATSLDELPQLFNVLKGDMSLVGPRPERPELIQRFREDWRGYVLRQHVKAGITGWAQVNGLRGDTSLRKRLQLDLFYIRHWSLGFDLKILWLTLFRGFIHKNAH